MSRLSLGIAVALAVCAPAGWAQAPSAGPYKILKTVKVGGTGGYDYVNVDVPARRLFIARTGPMPRIDVYDLDSFAKIGEVKTTNAHGAAIDPKSGHAFATSKPITMFDTKSLAVIKVIDVQGNPDGSFFDPSTDKAYILSHVSPHVTVIDAKEGSVDGTFDIGGEPEQAASDGKGHMYIDVEDMDNIAVVDQKAMKVTAHYDVKGKGGTCAGLAMDVKNRILFAACRNPANMVILNADTGNILAALPIGKGSDGVTFNPKTREAFSSQGIDGMLSIIKEKSPTEFVVEQTLTTMPNARTSALDTKTGHIILITAEFGPPTAPKQPGGRAGRGAIVPDSFSIIEVGK